MNTRRVVHSCALAVHVDRHQCCSQRWLIRSAAPDDKVISGARDNRKWKLMCSLDRVIDFVGIGFGIMSLSRTVFNLLLF